MTKEVMKRVEANGKRYDQICYSFIVLISLFILGLLAVAVFSFTNK